MNIYCVLFIDRLCNIEILLTTVHDAIHGLAAQRNGCVLHFLMLHCNTAPQLCNYEIMMGFLTQILLRLALLAPLTSKKSKSLLSTRESRCQSPARQSDSMHHDAVMRCGWRVCDLCESAGPEPRSPDGRCIDLTVLERKEKNDCCATVCSAVRCAVQAQTRYLCSHVHMICTWSLHRSLQSSKIPYNLQITTQRTSGRSKLTLLCCLFITKVTNSLPCPKSLKDVKEAFGVSYFCVKLIPGLCSHGFASLFLPDSYLDR